MQFKISPMVKWLCILCFGIFIGQQSLDRFAGTSLLQYLGLIPGLFLGKLFFWQIITYSFLHADVLHLFFNLMLLVFIGSDLEFIWGKSRFLTFHFFCAAFTGLTYVLVQLLFSSGSGMMTPLIGISGSVYGMLVAYGMYFSERQMLFMMLFPLKAKHFVWILATMELMTTLFSGKSEVLSSLAHISGMLAGYLFMLIVNPQSFTAFKSVFSQKLNLKMQSKKTKNSHLKLVVNKRKGNEDDDDKKPKTWH